MLHYMLHHILWFFRINGNRVNGEIGIRHGRPGSQRKRPRHGTPPPTSAPGGQRIYSDLAIQTALTVRSVYRLGLRQTEGFLRSVSALLGLNIRIPDPSTISLRSKHLGSIRASMSANSGPVHILVDSAGLRVHSGSEPRDEKSWRRWRKLHLAIDAKTGEFLASELSAHRGVIVRKSPVS